MKKGINIIGYARAESGLGEACRSAARVLASLDIPFCIVNFPHCPSRQEDYSWQAKEVETPLYDTNLIFINADQMLLHKELLMPYLSGRFNIGVWHWELPIFPSIWDEAFSMVQEVWAPSTFTLHSIAARSTVPVYHVPHSVKLDVDDDVNRASFQLPENAFLFLTMYETHSTIRRKNPVASIDAFQAAFDKDDETVGLVVKINGGKEAAHEVEGLHQKIEGYSNIFIIDDILEKKYVNSLIHVTDSFISLHRSEGFGLTLAEAMYLEKPVIATNWSANTDFMHKQNSCLVRYSLMVVTGYVKGLSREQKWAEPDKKDAQFYMRKMVQEQKWAKEIGIKGKNTIDSYLSIKNVGSIYKKRWDAIRSKSTL
ncbi:glycosyltransferase [Pontibacillus salicampi]|uniref:Glycosyltransferase n=1 Tax=Pontibacillus salicampi TaxID=1449801 RepID=A0ABV6LQ77_9BACI